MSKESPIGIRLRIDFGPLRSIGPGKIALLEHIERHESLSQAARELRMSYRRAWQLLDDLNHSFREPVAIASTGGAGGGGAELTTFGRDLVRAYRDVETAVAGQAQRRFATLASGSHKVRASSGKRLSRPVTKRRTERKS
jgi:molybdate transport system regulatory protein